MEEENRDLAVDEKKELLEEKKYYENVKLELNKIAFDNVLLEETKMHDGEQMQDIVEYNIYVKFNNENIAIATIKADGTLEPNYKILEDEKYTDEDRKKLGDMLNLLGLEQGKVNLDKLQTQLKEIEAKTKEELEHNKKKEDAETIKEKTEKDDEEKEKEDEEQEKKLEETEQEDEQEAIAKKKGIDAKNICKIRRDSQFYKNYPNIPKTAYFYLDEKDKIHAEYIDKDGIAQELKGFREIKDRPRVTSFGNDGQNIKEELPYRVMTAKGLEDKNHNTQDIRIAMYKDEYGYLRIETIHQGRNGEWEGKPIEVYGKERNTHQINRIIDEKHKTPHTGAIAKRHEELKQSGFSEDGIQLDDLSKKRKIDEYMQDGYTLKEANKIYDYVVGEKQLKEDEAKKKVNEEREEENNQKTPWGDAEERRFNRH